MQSLDLKKLTLGADSAEEDIRIGLLQYFVENESYRNLLNGSKYIVVGNRGVGKTAVFKYLSERNRKSGAIVIELSPEEYSYEILSAILRKESAGNWGKQSSYSISWQYLIFNLVFKEIVSKRRGLATGANKAIYDYVRDNLQEKDISPLGLFVSYLKRVEGAKLGKFEIGFQKKDLYKLYELQEIKELQPYLEKVLHQQKVYVFVDELDKGWDNSEDAKYFIAGLLQAAQKINSIHDNLKVFVSIRQELFDNIPQIYDDAQKIRGYIETIRWDEEGLLNFITLRIVNSFHSLKGLSPEYIWARVFQETLEYRQTKSFNYLIDRTQLRPREFLQYVRECVKYASADNRLVNYDDVSKASITYSENKTKDLASEYRFQYPSLMELFNTFRGSNYTLEKDELDYHLLQLSDGTIKLDNATWVRNHEYFELKKILWEIGFLKVWAIGGLKSGRKSGSSYLGHYELANINLDSIIRFQVHPAFWVYLGLRERKITK